MDTIDVDAQLEKKLREVLDGLNADNVRFRRSITEYPRSVELLGIRVADLTRKTETLEVDNGKADDR